MFNCFIDIKMRTLYTFLIIAFGFSTLFASNKINQTTIKRGNKIQIIANNREYEALPILSVKYLDLHILQENYNVIRYNRLNYADIEVPLDCPLDVFVSVLETDGNILGIDYNSEGDYNSIIPNDGHFGDQWYIPVIHADSAWLLTTGTPSVIVGILDSGTDWLHPDLGIGNDSYQNIYCNIIENDWTNQNNPTTGNNIDDDDNGYIDDYKGWNFGSGTNDSRGTFYHGTFVAGIIGAKTNNNCGISGIAGGYNSPGVSILPYCVGMTAPNTSVIDDAIIAAVDNGARIIQFSLSCPETNAVKSALQYAKNNDIIVVCASGNEYASSLPFPSSDTTVVAVGAIDENLHRASFSNYGSNLRLVAPGVNIYGLNLSTASSLYIQSDGTSFAAPQVSGIMSLMLSINPSLTRREVIDIIESTAQKVEGYSYTPQSGRPNGDWNDYVGYGLVDAYAAVKEAKSRYIQGPDYVCDTAKYYLIHPSQPGDTVLWSVHNGNYAYPHYSIIGANNQDTVYVRCERATPAIPSNPKSQDRQMLMGVQSISVTISNGTSETYTKEFREPTGAKPTVSVSNSAIIWRSGTSRTFTITNCVTAPDSVLTWEVKKTIVYTNGNSNVTTYSYYTGRTLTYIATAPLNAQAMLQFTATNTLSECEPKSEVLSFAVIRSPFLSAYDGGDILDVTISEDERGETSQQTSEEMSPRTLELWHNIYGSMGTQQVRSDHEQMDVTGLPHGVYVLLLKENGEVIAQTKVNIN